MRSTRLEEADGPGGLSTSQAIVIGYLMWKFGLSYEHTLNYVQSKRYCVSPTSVSACLSLQLGLPIHTLRQLADPKFSVQLREYEPITIAQKMLEAAGNSNMNARDHKRGNEDDEYAALHHHNERYHKKGADIIAMKTSINERFRIGILRRQGGKSASAGRVGRCTCVYRT